MNTETAGLAEASVTKITPIRVRSSPRARQVRSRSWIDLWTLILLIFPVFGTFFPPETYFDTSGGTSYSSGISLPITPISLVLISLSVAYYYIQVRRSRPVTHSWLAYLYVGVSFASIAWSPDPQLTFQRALRMLPAVGLGVLLPQYYSASRLLTLMVIAFLISGCASIFMGAFVPRFGIGSLGNGYENAWRGAMAHKNATGFVYGLALVVIIYAWLSGAARTSLCLLAFATCALMVVKADSATAIVSAAVAIASGFFIRSLRRVPIGLAAIILFTVALIITLVVGIFTLAPEVIFGILGRDLTFTGRTDIWDAVFDLIPQHLYRGFGYGFWLIDSPDRQYVYDAVGYAAAFSHNSWLDLLLNVGLLGTLPVVILFVRTMIKSGISAARQPSAIGTLYFAVIMFLLVRSNVEVEFNEPGLSGLFWLVWATVSIRPLIRNNQIVEQKPRYG